MASGNNDFSSPAPPPAAPPAVRSRRPKPPPPVGSLRPVAARTARPRPPPAEGTSAGAAGTATAAPRSASIRPAAASRPTPNYYGASNTPASPSAGATTAAAPQGMYGTNSRPVATASASGSGSGGMFMNPAGASGAPAPAAATAAAATASNSYYGSQPQQQPAAATTTHDAHDDWYSETPATSTSAPTSSSLYTQQQPQQPQQQQQFQQQQFQQQQQQPQVKAMNPYATSQYAQAPAPLEGSMQPSLFMPTAASGPTAMNPYANDNDGTLDNTWNDNNNNNNNNNNNSNNHANAPIDDDIHNEPPLLEELGINLGHIMMKTKAVVIPSQRWSGQNSALTDPALIVQDADLAGPLAFALLLGGELLLTGKIHFGYIYGFGLFGCLAMTLVLNLMSPQQAVSVWTVTSILGYSLLPVNILAAAKILLVNIANLSTLGRVLGVLTVLWSTTASTRLLEVGCGMRDQRYLIAYPIALLYSAFVLITIF
jgi:hypothetical protein